MNAIQALSLRKPDARNGSLSMTQSEANSRFSKKSNIREILVRNFFRKYPITNDVTDMEQLQIERQVATKMEGFVQTTPQINSKNLAEFESKLASEVNLRKGEVRGTRTGGTAQRATLLSPTGKLPMTNPKSSGRAVRSNKNNNQQQQFQLPSINSHAALGMGNNKSVDNPRSGLNAIQNAINRRSQVVNHHD